MVYGVLVTRCASQICFCQAPNDAVCLHMSAAHRAPTNSGHRSDNDIQYPPTHQTGLGSWVWGSLALVAWLCVGWLAGWLVGCLVVSLFDVVLATSNILQQTNHRDIQYPPPHLKQQTTINHLTSISSVAHVSAVWWRWILDVTANHRDIQYPPAHLKQQTTMNHLTYV